MIVNIHAAKTQLSRLIERTLAGEDVVIAKAGAPLAQLVPYQPASSPRQGGFLRGRIHIDAADEPPSVETALPESVLPEHLL